VDAYCVVDHAWICFRQLDGFARFFQIGASNEQVAAVCSEGAGDDGGEVGGVAGVGVVDAGVDWVGEVYAYLLCFVSSSALWSMDSEVGKGGKGREERGGGVHLCSGAYTLVGLAPRGWR
jgi:hypothetical protein